MPIAFNPKSKQVYLLLNAANNTPLKKKPECSLVNIEDMLPDLNNSMWLNKTIKEICT